MEPTQTLGQAQTHNKKELFVNIVKNPNTLTKLVEKFMKNPWIENQDKLDLIVNPKQLDKLYKLFSNFQNSRQSLANISISYKDNQLSAIVTTSQTKIHWIIDSRTSNHVTDDYHLFTTYSPSVRNIKVRITDESLLFVGGKES